VLLRRRGEFELFSGFIERIVAHAYVPTSKIGHLGLSRCGSCGLEWAGCAF
jgi:hypothetical protein